MDKGKRKKDDSAPPPPRKSGLKFAPKVPKKDMKIVPKMEIQEESKGYTVDKDVMMSLRTSQSMDDLGNKATAETERKDSDVSAAKLPKGDIEPWDYTHTNYPVILPVRKPYSENPEILDEEEFGQSSSNRAHIGELTAAEELGLTAGMNKPELLFFQLPLSLPLARIIQGCKEKELPGTTDDLKWNDWESNQPIQGCRLNELPDGLMGKIIVYKSGKVKMKLGDALFDVSAGTKCTFAQEAVAINTRGKLCCSLGEVNKRAIVTPDIDFLLDPMEME